MSTQTSASSGEPQIPLGYGTLYAQKGGYRPRAVVAVEGSELTRVLSRPPMAEYLRRLLRRRHFIMADARAKVEAGNRTNLLGSVWLVLNPLLDGIVYFAIFGLILQSSRGIENFPGYLIIGVFLFQFTTRCLVQGSRSVISGKSMIRSFAFPRASLPVATIIRETLSFVPALITMLVLVLAMPSLMPALNPNADAIELHVTWRWLLLPLIFALQFALNLGLALFTARLTARIPDLTQVISIVVRFWLYGSAVFFSIDRFAAFPAMQDLMRVNPMYIVLDMARDSLLYSTTPSWTSWTLLSVWAIGLLVAGMVFFWRGEESYGAA